MDAPTTTLIDGHPVDGPRLAEPCQRYGVAELAVFASFARGEASESSDVDLLYVLMPGARLGFAINELEDELAKLFDRPVDLVAKRALHRLIRHDVLTEARPLYAALPSAARRDHRRSGAHRRADRRANGVGLR